MKTPLLTTELVATIEATRCVYCHAYLEAVEHRGLVFARCPSGDGLIFYPLPADEGLIDRVLEVEGQFLRDQRSTK